MASDAIIGPGIVGLAVGLDLNWKHPRLLIVLLEKENTVTTHQSRSQQQCPLLLAHNCPAALRLAANVASDITSVRGLLLKGAAP